MELSKAALPDEKAPDPETAEEICELLEQTMLKYFPQEAGNSEGPASSVPLVPQRRGLAADQEPNLACAQKGRQWRLILPLP